ncbi:MAG: PBP1A family penicillin-binding protein, partial [Bdellovibrionales bacterium]|nr:PBP1A family penicillin-binding protein [Bdellovibrionales bacterium]
PGKKNSTRKSKLKKNIKKRSSKKTRFKFPKLWKVLVLLVAVGAATSIATWIHVDKRVQLFLTRKGIAQKSAIYTDELKVFPNPELSFEKVKNILGKRGYKSATSSVINPGEYLLGEKIIKLKTREFRTPAGTIRSAKDIAIDFEDSETHKINFTSNGESLDQFYFEPIVLSSFNSDNVRVAQYLPLSEIPRLLQAAVVVTEDQRFMQHYGIDLVGIGRAMVSNILSLSIKQGGSTITQQLAKNLFFSSKKTLTRKYFEAFAALSLEHRISKAEILERYLNEVYLGQEGSIAIHGVAEASKAFFRKEVSDLNLSQMALIAAVIKAPSYYSPRSNQSRAKERRDLVLKLMFEAGTITDKQYRKAIKTDLNVVKDSLHTKIAPHFLDALRRHINNTINMDAVRLAGGALFTSLNSEMQICASESLSAGLNTLEETYPSLKRKRNKLQAGLVAIETYSGKVRAWVGSRNFAGNQFDHVDQAKRQIGSTIKPFLYLTALDPSANPSDTATPMTVLRDEPFQLEVNGKLWQPQNYDKQPRGRVTLRYALENSLNLAAVYTANKVGFEKIAQTARNFDLSDQILAVPSLALGALDTTLLRMTTAYSGLANGGILTSPRMFISILDPQGALLNTSSIEERFVSNPAPTFVITNLMRGVVERGTGNIIRRKGFQYPVAGKTGTSNDTRDAWFLGFTPELAVGVWVGFDDNAKLGLTGSSGAAPIWADFMKCSAAYLRGLPFIPPKGVSFVKVDSSTGLRVSPNCPARGTAVSEIFVSGTEPDPLCGRLDNSEEHFQSERRSIPEAFKNDE